MVTAAPAQKQVEVIAWMREPKLPGMFGKAVHTDWTLKTSEPTSKAASFEVGRDSWLLPTDFASRSEYRFPHMVQDSLRPQAIDDARRAAQQIIGHADLAGLQEIPTDFFFDRDQVQIGMGKVMIRQGGEAHTYLGKLDQMRGLLDITKGAVSTILGY